MEILIIKSAKAGKTYPNFNFFKTTKQIQNSISIIPNRLDIFQFK